MRRLHTALGAGTLLLALTACAGQHDDVGFGGQPQPPPPGPVQPKPEQARTPVPASQLSPDRVGRVWTQDAGTVLVVTGREGGCSRVHAEPPQQNRNQVKVVLVNETPQQPQMCTMDLRYPPLAIRLDGPLEQRKVVVEQRDVKVPHL